MARENWSRDELILAFNLYCKTPFGKIDGRNPEIISLAKVIGRSPSAVSWKLANFARLDPSILERGLSGARHGSKSDIEIWDEFNSDWESLSYESEKLFAEFYGNKIEDLEPSDEVLLIKEGKEREAVVRIRVNQSFFRSAVLAAYGYSCCITGLSVSQLLNASHIVPWSQDINNRGNPHNGLCLNPTHDRAFDRGLITVTPEYRVQVSAELQQIESDEALKLFLLDYDNQPIHLPSRFAPDVSFLKYHNENIFKG